MIGAILPLLMQAAAPAPSARPAEHWEPWLTWACIVREGKRSPYVLNGVIARREDPDRPEPGMRLERALRVLRDDSKMLAGRQARSPLFVVRRPGEFWAAFYDRKGEKPGGTRMLFLKSRDGGGAGTVELTAGPAGSKPYARGQCLTRLVGPEAKS